MRYGGTAPDLGGYESGLDAGPRTGGAPGHAGLFAVMDGATCGNGPGPRTMFPEEQGSDSRQRRQVAIDAVAARLMGFDPLSIGHIRMAQEAGLGTGPAGGDNLASREGDLLWFSPLKALQNLFFHTPLVYALVFGSAAYHDWLWYPTKGKRRIEALPPWAVSPA